MKKRLFLYLLLSVMAISIIYALPDYSTQDATQDTPLAVENQPENSTFNALLELFPPFFKKLSYLVGGIFGLYFLLLLIRIYFEQKNLKVLKDIRYDLDRLNEHYGLSYSHATRSRWKKIKNIFHLK